MAPQFLVLLVGNYPPDHQTSMQRFADLLHSQLASRGVATEFIRPEPRFGRLKSGSTGLGKWLGYLDKFALFPRLLRRRCREQLQSTRRMIVHVCDHSNSVYVRQLWRSPHLVTCHDLLAVRSARGEFAENPTGW